MSQAMEDVSEPPELSQSLVVATSESAHQKRKITALEEKLQVLESGHAVKKREMDYYISKGRAIRQIVTLFDNIEDLISENDRRCDLDEDEDMTVDQHRLQIGYIALNHTLPWFHSKASDLENEDLMYMLQKLRQGADNPSKIEKIAPVRHYTKWEPDVDTRIADTKERAAKEDEEATEDLRVYSDGYATEGKVGGAAV
ncbi:hypothetical protein DEU56DRAFT_911420 [Suillus clintonianus]|uniref:uncharacterized protein n=1 Tax=Suillus clintonianus TaxID=1904413 RepID=UPI001B8787F6|nr:uncharacterized protein DEU56DRAFT_911420 [Suillus clintonianus]KAG2141312.1 hypothetical protein DEU56DRAFT_911420 [Suillus clintonianus]